MRVSAVDITLIAQRRNHQDVPRPADVPQVVFAKPVEISPMALALMTGRGLLVNVVC